ncbi:hypothetical protein BLNAU_20284 [Blattamonas nauphoetae]|uniref:RRM domain-containing protein n=1 Tax=Blattamonas nauphoetae TaxID=2049346 RepID=A0ABQ9WZ67_9EUKA|nr:hypothetical protein BLNAU_20284 [Blattamonas nauphoetae]
MRSTNVLSTQAIFLNNIPPTFHRNDIYHMLTHIGNIISISKHIDHIADVIFAIVVFSSAHEATNAISYLRQTYFVKYPLSVMPYPYLPNATPIHKPPHQTHHPDSRSSFNSRFLSSFPQKTTSQSSTSSTSSTSRPTETKEHSSTNCKVKRSISDGINDLYQHCKKFQLSQRTPNDSTKLRTHCKDSFPIITQLFSASFARFPMFPAHTELVLLLLKSSQIALHFDVIEPSVLLRPFYPYLTAFFKHILSTDVQFELVSPVSRFISLALKNDATQATRFLLHGYHLAVVSRLQDCSLLLPEFPQDLLLILLSVSNEDHELYLNFRDGLAKEGFQGILDAFLVDSMNMYKHDLTLLHNRLFCINLLV